MNLRTYVQSIAQTMGSNVPIMYRLLAEHGREFSSPGGEEKGPEGECFGNAFKLVQDCPEIRGKGLMYCEGLAMKDSLGVPLDHAWVLNAEGQVLDPTWEGPTQYFGAVFQYDWLIKHVLYTRYYGVLGNLYRLKRNPDEVLQYLKGGLVK